MPQALFAQYLVWDTPYRRDIIGPATELRGTNYPMS